MLFYLKVYLCALVGFLAIDLVWLGVVARSFYRKQLGFLLADQPNWLAAIIFYLLFVAGMLVFAIWVSWTSRMGASADRGGHMASYSSQMLYKDPLEPDQGRATAADLTLRVGRNVLVRGAQLAELATRLPWVSRTWYNPLLLITLIAVVLGAWRCWQHPWDAVASLYFFSHFGVYLLWPFDENQRFLLPVAPIGFLLAVRGMKAGVSLLSTQKGKAIPVALWMIVAAAAATAAVSRPLGRQELLSLALWTGCAIWFTLRSLPRRPGFVLWRPSPVVAKAGLAVVFAVLCLAGLAGR